MAVVSCAGVGEPVQPSAHSAIMACDWDFAVVRKRKERLDYALLKGPRSHSGVQVRGRVDLGRHLSDVDLPQPRLFPSCFSCFSSEASILEGGSEQHGGTMHPGPLRPLRVPRSAPGLCSAPARGDIWQCRESRCTLALNLSQRKAALGQGAGSDLAVCPPCLRVLLRSTKGDGQTLCVNGG